MTTKVLREPGDVDKLSRFLSARTKWPITVSIVQGASRTDAANRLAQRWNADISRQLGDMSFEEVRAFNKLTFGVPALCQQDPKYQEQFDRVLGPLSYEQRLEAIQIFDIPVTRMLKVKPMSEYMDAVHRFWTSKGVVLTNPDDQGLEDMLR